MRLLTRGRLMILVVAIALLAINVVALRWSANLFSNKAPKSLVRNGERVSKLKGKSLMSRTNVELEMKSPTSLVLYFSAAQTPGFSTELVKYAETLSQRHKKDGLTIVVVVQDDIAELKTLIDSTLVTYNVIVDEGKQIQDQLGLQNAEEGVFVFDNEGLCRFSTRRPVSSGDLRQLVAMELLKTDPLQMPAEVTTSLQEGKSIGSFALLDARSMKMISMSDVRSESSTPTHYIFFTADCSVCSLPIYLEDLKKFERDHLKGKEKNLVLVFDFNFSRTDVLAQLRNNLIVTPAYISKEQLPQLNYTDDRYRLVGKTVAVVQTDDQRIVHEIYPLNSRLLAQSQSKNPAPKPSSEANATGPAYEEMFSGIPFTAYDVASYHGKYFLTDFDGNRLLIVKDNMEIEKDLGRIGSGPGRLFHPGYIDVGNDGTIFVEDGGNERIVKFDQAGNFLGELRLKDYQGFAVGPQSELYLGQPNDGHLITVYSSSGKKLRSFGNLKKVSDIYGEAGRAKDDPFKIAFNRVRLATDRDGNIFVSFMLTPLIQKYTPDGTLIFERRLEAPEIDRLMEAIQKTKYIATHSDGADARIVALDPVVDPANGNIMVPFVDGSIFVTDRDGNKLTLLRPSWTRRGDGGFHPFVAGLGAKGELLVTPFPPKHWYRLRISVENDNSAAATSSRSQAIATR